MSWCAIVGIGNSVGLREMSVPSCRQPSIRQPSSFGCVKPRHRRTLYRARSVALATRMGRTMAGRQSQSTRLRRRNNSAPPEISSSHNYPGDLGTIEMAARDTDQPSCNAARQLVECFAQAQESPRYVLGTASCSAAARTHRPSRPRPPFASAFARLAAEMAFSFPPPVFALSTLRSRRATRTAAACTTRLTAATRGRLTD